MAPKLTTTKAVKYHGWTLPKGTEVEVLSLDLCEFGGPATLKVAHPRHEGAFIGLPASAAPMAWDMAEAGLIPTTFVDETGRRQTVQVAA